MKRFKLSRHRATETAKGPRLLDSARKQLVPDKPEEQVRQSVLRCLMTEYGYPPVALLSEEPVARGTADRRRADVLIRLPASVMRARFQVADVSSNTTSEPTYSERRRAVEARIGHAPGVMCIDVPDLVQLSVDGEDLACRVLGFEKLNAGHALAMRPPPGGPQGLPPLLVVLVDGWGQTPEEVRFANGLGIPELEWTYEGSLALIDAMAPSDGSDPNTRLWLEASALSADGQSGAFIAYANDDEHHGVLVWVQPSEEGGDEDFDDVPDDSVGAAADATEPAVRHVGDGRVLVVVECKAPAVAITKEVISQGHGYAETLDAKFLVTTNGIDTRSFTLSDDGTLVAIDDIPDYEAVINDRVMSVFACQAYAKEPELPSDTDRRPDCVRFHARLRDIVGMDAPAEMWTAILAFDDAIHHPEQLVARPRGSHGISFVKDLGVNHHAPGSPTGGGWPGAFRDILIEDITGSQLILGLSIQAGFFAVDSRWLAGGYTTAGGYTYLLVALSDDSNYEAVLQLPFDRDLKRSTDRWLLTHNGALTAGRGAVKRQLLFDALAEAAPELIRDRHVDLGGFPSSVVPIPEDCLWDMLGRITRYVLVRREVKDAVKKSRRKRRQKRRV